MPQIFNDVNPPEGFRSYVRRLERELGRLERADGERTAGAAATPERIAVGPGGRLGNNTKSQAAFEAREGENNEVIQRFTLDETRREYVAVEPENAVVPRARSARFGAQTSATKLLFNKQTPRETQWRVTGCLRRKISQNVTVLHSHKVSRSHFGGLMICGSVWTCPPCAAKISERRKLEIERATTIHTKAGGALYMLTFTVPHTRCDELGVLLPRLSKARTYMREQRAFKALKADMGYVGDMRALEITYGDANGWHPHEHDLWLTDKPLPRLKLRRLLADLFTLWCRACAKAGLAAPNRKRGVNVKKMDTADEYMAKFGRETTWGTASELTKQHIKTGKAGRMSSFDLLRLYESGDKHAGQLFIQFAKAFFGKRQIIWSKGLKAMFGVQEIADEELAKEEAEDSAIVTEIYGDEWSLVLRQSYEARGIILELAESGGAEAVKLYLSRLVDGEVSRRRIVANSGTRTVYVPRL